MDFAAYEDSDEDEDGWDMEERVDEAELERHRRAVEARYRRRKRGSQPRRTLTKSQYSKIDPIEWKNVLLFIDADIMDIYDKANDIIIISLPYKLTDIKQAITEFICNNFNDESLLSCFDIVLNYLNPNKKYIQWKANGDQKNKDNKDSNKWSITKYDKLIETEAMIVINPKNNEFISIPRNVENLKGENFYEWEISWDQLSKYNYHYSEVNDFICDKLANICLEGKFHLTQKKQNWKGRTDFDRISEVGYKNNAGFVKVATILNTTKDKIHLDLGDGMKQWINIPNEKLCDPNTSMSSLLDRLQHKPEWRAEDADRQIEGDQHDNSAEVVTR